MPNSEGCPRCGSRQVDEYTHSDCPPGATPEDHRHLVCANAACEYEWVEPLPVAVTPEPSPGEVTDAGSR
jgi:hypothetical protein